MKDLKETKAPIYGKMQLLESYKTPSGEKRMRVRGVCQGVNRVNENNRRYGKKIWEKNFSPESALTKALKERTALGELEHPDSGMTHLGRVSHLVEKAWLEDLKEGNEFGVPAGEWVIGEFLIFNTPGGQILQELYNCNVPVGVSSRGRGTTESVEGVDEVNEDYVCETWDFVAQPSVIFARPVKVESKDQIKEGLEIVNKLKGKVDKVCLIESASKLSEICKGIKNAEDIESKKIIKETLKKVISKLNGVKESKSNMQCKVNKDKGVNMKSKKDIKTESVLLNGFVKKILKLREEIETLKAEKNTVEISDALKNSKTLLDKVKELQVENEGLVKQRDKAINIAEQLRTHLLDIHEAVPSMREKERMGRKLRPSRRLAIARKAEETKESKAEKRKQLIEKIRAKRNEKENMKESRTEKLRAFLKERKLKESKTVGQKPEVRTVKKVVDPTKTESLKTVTESRKPTTLLEQIISAGY